MNGLQPFSHADQAEPASAGRLEIKARALVTDGQLDLIASAAKLHLDLPGAAMLDRTWIKSCAGSFRYTLCNGSSGGIGQCQGFEIPALPNAREVGAREN